MSLLSGLRFARRMFEAPAPIGDIDQRTHHHDRRKNAVMIEAAAWSGWRIESH